jgi:hypothetical protein
MFSKSAVAGVACLALAGSLCVSNLVHAVESSRKSQGKPRGQATIPTPGPYNTKPQTHPPQKPSQEPPTCYGPGCPGEMQLEGK